MKILISDENESMGYICYEYECEQSIPPATRRLFVVFWAGENTKRVVYSCQRRFAEEMQLFVGSNLAEYSELHKAKEFVGAAFLNWAGEPNGGTQNPATDPLLKS